MNTPQAPDVFTLQSDKNEYIESEYGKKLIKYRDWCKIEAQRLGREFCEDGEKCWVGKEFLHVLPS